MTEKQLLKLGFTKIKFADSFWFYLKYKKHHFITNDDYYNKGKDDWSIGYSDNKNPDNDYMWFNNNINTVAKFKALFYFTTGVKFDTLKNKK